MLPKEEIIHSSAVHNVSLESSAVVHSRVQALRISSACTKDVILSIRST
jgi:hypothetical protein